MKKCEILSFGMKRGILYCTEKNQKISIFEKTTVHVTGLQVHLTLVTGYE